jgi:hypothetical protein
MCNILQSQKTSQIGCSVGELPGYGRIFRVDKFGHLGHVFNIEYSVDFVNCLK